jgi:T5SS/PEP-CTERM-associated repeat protein
VRGAGSTWTVESDGASGDLYVGFLGEGRLVLEAGGRVAAGGDLSVGSAFEPRPIEIALAGPDDYSVPAISAGGAADVGVLTVTLIPGFVPSAGDAFALAAAARGLAGAAVDLAPAPAGLVWGVSQSDVSITAFLVPEFCTESDEDCNDNGIDDACEIFFGVAADSDGNGVLDECEVPCPGDLDGDGATGFDDLLVVLGAWGGCLECPEDLDGDGIVGFGDLLIVLASWGPCP